MTTNQTKGTDMQNEQNDQQTQKLVEQVLTSQSRYQYNDADQREAGFDNDDYR